MDQVVDAQLFELENDRAEVGPPDLGVRVLNQVVLKRRLGVEPERLSRLRPPGTPGTLLRRRLGDRSHKERLDTRPRVVHLLLGKPRVDHIHHPVNSQRRFCNVGRHNDLPPGRPIRTPRLGRTVEDPLLELRRERRVQREHKRRPHLGPHVLDLAPQPLHSLLDLLLTREKDQHVSRRLHSVDLQRSPDRRLQVVFHRERSVKDVDPVHPPGDGNERRTVKVGLELSGVQRGRHDHNLDVLPRVGNLLEEPQENVCGQRPLVRLVQNDVRVLFQQRVAHGLAQQHPVRHVLDNRRVVGPVLKPDRVSHLGPQRDVHLVCHTRRNRHRSNTTRLRTRNHLSSRKPFCRKKLRNLRRLSRPSLSHKHSHLVVPHSLQNVLLLRPHRQRLARLEDLIVPITVLSSRVWIQLGGVSENG